MPVVKDRMAEFKSQAPVRLICFEKIFTYEILVAW